MGRNILIVSERLGSGFECKYSIVHIPLDPTIYSYGNAKRSACGWWFLTLTHTLVVSHACSSSSFLPQFFSSNLENWMSLFHSLSFSPYMSVFVRVVIMHIYLVRELSVRINTSVYSFIPVPMLLRELMFLQYRSCNSNRYIRTKI